MLGIVFGLIALVFVVRCAALWWMQEAILFPRGFANQAPPMPTPPGTEVWTLETDAGPVNAWLIRAQTAPTGAQRPAVVFSHGNGERVDTAASIASMYGAMGIDTLLIEYRGYGQSAGEPSQATLVADASAFVARLAAREDIDAERIAYHGRSLGAAVLFQVAAHRPPAAMIAESAFSSVVALAHRQFVPGFLVRHPFRSDRVVRTLESPVLFLHGDRDRIAPVTHARRLHALASTSELVIQPAGHNDFPSDPRAYRESIERLLTESGVLGPATPDSAAPEHSEAPDSGLESGPESGDLRVPSAGPSDRLDP